MSFPDTPRLSSAQKIKIEVGGTWGSGRTPHRNMPTHPRLKKFYSTVFINSINVLCSSTSCPVLAISQRLHIKIVLQLLNQGVNIFFPGSFWPILDYFACFSSKALLFTYISDSSPSQKFMTCSRIIQHRPVCHKKKKKVSLHASNTSQTFTGNVPPSHKDWLPVGCHKP